jgi:protein-disulfide isomerase
MSTVENITDPLDVNEGKSSSRLVQTIKDGEEEYLVISKGLVLNVAIALIFFLLGGIAGGFVGVKMFGSTAVASVPAAPQAAAVQPTQPPARLDNVSVDNDPSIGSPNAPVTIVEFSDFHCSFCRRFHDETYEAILDEYGDQVNFVYRDFPVVGGQQAAEAAECAYEQDGFWPYHDALFANPQGYSSADDYVNLAVDQGLDGDQFRECYESGKYRDEIAADYNDGRNYGVTGTPTFFINGVRIVGAQPLDVFLQTIEQELENGG